LRVSTSRRANKTSVMHEKFSQSCLIEGSPCKSTKWWKEFWDQFKSCYEALVDKEARNGTSDSKYVDLRGNVLPPDFSFSMNAILNAIQEIANCSSFQIRYWKLYWNFGKFNYQVNSVPTKSSTFILYQRYLIA